MRGPRKRSSYSSRKARVKIPWPSSKPFRILSIDGGGIKGLFAAKLLAELEATLPEGETIADCFELVAGTSTGGIIALGIGLSVSCRDIYEMYITEGEKIFPPARVFSSVIRWARRHLMHAYDSKPLEAALRKIFGKRLLCESKAALCIPVFDGLYGEPHIYKTPHHPVYHLDAKRECVSIALATAAAPTYFRPHQHNGYLLVDGGVIANNPIMIALVDVLACFDVRPQQIRIVSIGFGDKPYIIPKWKIRFGGLISYAKLALGMMAIQSQNALGQTRLLVGPENVLRIAPDIEDKVIDMDDYVRSKALLPGEAEKQFLRHRAKIRKFIRK